MVIGAPSVSSAVDDSIIDIPLNSPDPSTGHELLTVSLGEGSKESLTETQTKYC